MALALFVEVSTLTITLRSTALCCKVMRLPRRVSKPLPLMTDDERIAFEGRDGGEPALWPEVGSRAMQRLLVRFCSGGPGVAEFREQKMNIVNHAGPGRFTEQ